MSPTLWKSMAIGAVSSASMLGLGCSGVCEVDAECDPVECGKVEIQACLDRTRESGAPWPLGRGRPGSCATEDDCDELEGLIGGTGTGTGFDTGTGTGGAGGSP